jgi:HPt (histidine-containing phosphotransfer) domain-containing protein
MKTSSALQADVPEAAETVLNENLLAQYRTRKTGLLERLIAAYLDEAPRFFQAVRQGDEANNFDAVKLNAHALKSCSYNLGATRLSKVCQAIENAANSKDADGIKSLLLKLGPECFEAEQALRAELFKLKGQKL